MSIRANVQDETTKTQKYIRKTAPEDELLKEFPRCQKPINAVKEDRPSWRDKSLLCMY